VNTVIATIFEIRVW